MEGLSDFLNRPTKVMQGPSTPKFMSLIKCIYQWKGSYAIKWIKGWKNGIGAKWNWKWSTVQWLGARMVAERCAIREYSWRALSHSTWAIIWEYRTEAKWNWMWGTVERPWAGSMELHRTDITQVWKRRGLELCEIYHTLLGL